MPSFDPFADPSLDSLPRAAAPPTPAELGPRLLAGVLDGVLVLVPAALGTWVFNLLLGSTLNRLLAGWGWLVGGAILPLLAVGLYRALNAESLSRDGQSWGKRRCGLRIVKADGSVPTLRESFTLRYAVPTLCLAVPYVGALVPLADLAMALRPSRRCLHDELAGTYVVRAS